MSTKASPGAYARNRPVAVADSLGDLRGPAEGVVRLPHVLDWGPNPLYDLADPDRLLMMYAVVLTEALDANDLIPFLNGRTLRRVWGELNLAARIRDRWEERFPLLKE